MGRSWQYVDLHSHIIPDVDDGSPALRDSLIMLDQAYAEGIRLMICTPHYGQSNPGLKHDKVKKNFDLLSKFGGIRHPDMDLFLGNELYYKQGIIGDVKRGRALSLANTKSILVEFSYQTNFVELENCVHEFTMAGYRPVIAHIERYENIIGDTNAVGGLRNTGAYIQVNTKSFVEAGSKRNIWATELLKHGFIDVVSTDCHNYKTRRPIMETAIIKMIETVGEEQVYDIISKNVYKILRGDR